MTPWRTYADPPIPDPDRGRDDRRAAGRARRDEFGFDTALAGDASGFVVWMCADSLDAVAGPRGPVVDACQVDDALPGPWEADLLDLARRQEWTGRAAEAMAEGYQQAIASIAAEPLHSSREQALRRARRLAEDVDPATAQSSETAARRLVSPGLRLRHDRVAERWQSDVGPSGDISPELAQYRESLPEPMARLAAGYRIGDALADGDGRLMVLLSRGADRDDVLLLEAVPVGASSREERYGVWRDGSDVQRVLLAREVVPLVPADMPGWSTSPDGTTARVWSRARAARSGSTWGGGRGSARRLGAALGLLHAVGGDAPSLAGYLGHSRRFPAAVRSAVRDG